MQMHFPLLDAVSNTIVVQQRDAFSNTCQKFNRKFFKLDPSSEKCFQLRHAVRSNNTLRRHFREKPAIWEHRYNLMWNALRGIYCRAT